MGGLLIGIEAGESSELVLGPSSGGESESTSISGGATWQVGVGLLFGESR